jgi:hypothetical protein
MAAPQVAMAKPTARTLFKTFITNAPWYEMKVTEKTGRISISKRRANLCCRREERVIDPICLRFGAKWFRFGNLNSTANPEMSPFGNLKKKGR